MSIKSELQRLDAVRDALVESVNSKGGSLPEDATLWQVMAGVDAIQQGGGTDAPTFGGGHLRAMRAGSDRVSGGRCHGI